MEYSFFSKKRLCSSTCHRGKNTKKVFSGNRSLLSLCFLSLLSIGLIGCSAEDQDKGKESTPRVWLSSTEVEFEPTDLFNSDVKYITITNTATNAMDTLSIASVYFDEVDDKYFSTDFSVPVELAGGDTYTMAITYHHKEAGTKYGSLYISHTGESGIEIVSLITASDVNGENNQAQDTGNVNPRNTNPEFSKNQLADMPAVSVTSMQFGPDDRLYVADMRGSINAHNIERVGTGDYRVTATETIDLIRLIPNHDDDGTPNPSIVNRLVTGLLVTGTAQNPVIFVGSSDPRFGGGSTHTDTNLDTNSSVISRLTKSGGQWSKLDLVRGLPRSEENHSINGLALDTSSNLLFVAMGGHTNQGAMSQNFANLPEYALSAAILEIDLNAIGETTYDLPTLDDETRPGIIDSNDPFGGNDGRNQARLVVGGPVQVYAPGFRNAYDLTLTSTGRLYTIDNGPNSGWGGTPHSSTSNLCVNDVSEPGATHLDALHYVAARGYYGGHPNPTRASQMNVFNSGNPQTPVDIGNPIECDFLAPGPADGSLSLFNSSTNGLTEYKASNFDGEMQGNLLTVSYDKKVYRLQLNSTGDAVVSKTVLFSNTTQGTPLEVIAQGDNETFPGTIWVGDFTGKKIQVFEPVDYLNPGGGGVCIPTTGLFDSDQDGYSDQDELLNGTNRCNAGDIPADADGDFLSNRVDNDDDNDGIDDLVDAFPLDNQNGRSTALPINYGWENDAPSAGHLFNMGFTGLMSNGSTDYLDLFDANNITAGGAAGVFTIDSVPGTDPYGSVNNQEYAFQFGVDVDQSTPGFTVATRVLSPFSGTTPDRYRSMGLFIGTGDQDNYAKMVISSRSSTGGIQFAVERNGTFQNISSLSAQIVNADYVDLQIHVDPAQATISASYSITTNGITAPTIQLPETTIPASWLTDTSGLAVGLIATSYRSTPFTVTWDYIKVTSDNTGTTTSGTTTSGTTTSGTTTSGTTTSGTTTSGTTTSGTTTSGTTTSGTTTSGAPTSGTPASVAGMVSIEVENYDRLDNTGTHQWIAGSMANPSGTGSMITTPDIGTLKSGKTGSPAMHYDIYFSETGIYTVWLRGWGDTLNGRGRNDSVHVGLDGALGSAAALQNFPANWSWSRDKRGGGYTTLNVTSVGMHTVSIWMREDGLTLDKLVLAKDSSFTPSGNGPAETLTVTSGTTTTGTTSSGTTTSGTTTAGTTTSGTTTSGTTTAGTTTSGSGTNTMPTSINGTVSIEVENYTGNDSTTTHEWIASNQTQASGTGSMVTTPNNGTLRTGKTGSPAMHYQVNFTETGLYTVWLRGWGDTVNGEGRNDSAHVGLNGTLGSAAALQNFPSSWGWSREKRGGGYTTINVTSTGVQTVSIWMREDGLILDKLLLVKNGNYTPSGTGPAETLSPAP